MSIATENRVPLWQVCRNTGTTRRDLVDLAKRLDLTIDVDLVTGEVYLSKSELRELLYSLADR